MRRPDGLSWQDVTLTPMKVEVLETDSTPPQFRRFHDWRRTYPAGMVVPN